MSLKAFHLFFIAASTFLTLGFSFWCLRLFAQQHRGGYLAAGILTLVVAAGLTYYSNLFLRKLRSISLG